MGSVYEFNNHRSKEFPLFAEDATFTDDTVLTVAVADVLLNGGDYAHALKRWYRRYPNESYGGRFGLWAANNESQPYSSWGNGSAMRVSPVGYASDDIEEVMALAKATAAPTHNHREGIKGARAVASAILLARQGADKARIREWCEERFGYDLSVSLDDIRPNYAFNESCQGTVPPAILAFLEAEDFEDALRNAISIGGDSDTIACITGGIAQAYFGIPDWIAQEAMARLDQPLAEITLAFQQRYPRDTRRPGQ